VVQLHALDSKVVGQTEARIFTPPLVDISKPENSYGHAVIRFAANILKQPLTPWQEWLVIRAGELLPDGRPRFRQVLVLIARQNGKTFLMQVLAAYWLYVECQRFILGMSSSLQLAKETMQATVEMVELIPHLKRDIDRVLEGNNDVHFSTKLNSKYKTVAATRKAARGKRTDRLMVDELREQYDDEAYKAGMNTMNARPYGQSWFFSNAGDDRSVVLNMLQEMAVMWIDTQGTEGDTRLGMFEWSTPPEMSLTDKLGWAMANPSMNLGGDHISEDVIHSEILKALKFGGSVEAGIRTEVLCQRVKTLNGAIDPVAWSLCELDEPMDKSLPVALCIDMSMDSQHATLMAAQTLPDGRRRLEIVAAWEGKGTTIRIQRELPGLVAKIRPRVVGWMPIGPMAALAAQLKSRPGVRPWLGTTSVVEISEEVAAVCMGFAEDVSNEQVLHNGDPLLSLHVLGASKKMSGDRWKFSRQDGGYCDAAYAAGGALHLVKTLPAQQKPVLISVKPSNS
jgi:hypothetical protein